MHKRIALLIIGFVLFIGAFLLYQLFSGASFHSWRRPAPPVVASTQEDHLPTLEKRSPTGELKYLVTWKAMKQLADAAGKLLPGQFTLTEPNASFFTHDGREISIRADKCEIAVDNLHAISAENSGEKVAPTPRSGRLSGNVRLTISGKPGDADGSKGVNGEGNGETVIFFDDDLILNNTDRLLTSPGKVHVRSDVVDFDGEGLTLSYNIDQTRENQKDEMPVEFFRIENGTKDNQNMIVVKRGAKKLAHDADKQPGGQGKGGATGAGKTEGPLVPQRPYKLTFGQDVTVTTGKTSLTTDRLLAYFLFASGEAQKAASTAPAVEEDGGAGTGAGVNPGVAATRPAPVLRPIAPPQPDDLVIRFVGSLEMRPAADDDIKLLEADDYAIEAVGTASHPVLVSETSKWSAKAGLLRFHKDAIKPEEARRLDLLPGELKDVNFSSVVANSTDRAVINCNGVGVLLDESLQNAEHVALAGPGTMEVPSTAMHRKDTSGPVTASWARALNLDLVNVVSDPKKPKQTEQTIRRAVFDGATIHDPSFDLAADSLDVLLAGTDVPGTARVLEHLLAQGNVDVKSYRKGAKGPADANASGLTAQRLEVLTVVPAEGKQPVPAKLLADGNVNAWQFAEQKAGAKDAAGGAGQRKQTVMTPHLEADLKQKVRKPGAAAGSSETSLAGLGGDIEPAHILANQGVQIEIESGKTQAIVVNAETLDADMPLHAVLSGSKDKGTPVVITRGEDKITGGTIVLDQDLADASHDIFRIPGPGDFLMTVPPSKGAKGRKEPIPMKGTWTRDMDFDSKTMLATFNGDVDINMLGKENQTSELTCHRVLRVKLHEEAAGKSSAASSALDSAGIGGLESISAEGKVDANMLQWTDDPGHPIFRMDLNAEQIMYVDATHRLTIPGQGSMIVDDHRPEKKADSEQSSRGDSAFQWGDSLTYDTVAGVITLNKAVTMFYTPDKPFHVPGEKGNAAAKPVASHVELRADLLKATLVPVKDASVAAAPASPVGLGGDGNMKLSTVVAGSDTSTGYATVDMDDSHLTGHTISFDALKYLMTATSTDIVSATVTRDNKGSVEAEKIVWDLTKGENSFEFTNPHGSLESISDMQTGR